MSYRVTAPLVLVRNAVGQHFHAYFGSVVDLLEEQAHHLLGLGMVEKVSDDPATLQASGPSGPPANDDPKPLQAATEAVLRDWLSKRECGHTAEELAAMSRDDLRALVDAL